MYGLEPWNRKWRTLWCWTHLYVHYKRAQIDLRGLPNKERCLCWEDGHSHFGELVWRNLSELQGWWIKVGRFLSTRGELLPKEYVTYLGGLQEMIPSVEWGLVEGVLEEEFGSDWGLLFEEVRQEPVASTCVGQIHRGVLSGGERRVMLKIQPPGIREVLALDERILEELSVVFGLEQGSVGLDIVSGLGAGERSRCGEPDFRVELENQERAYRMLGDAGMHVIVPRVYGEYSTGRVLTMECLEGFRITDRALLEEFGVDKRGLLEALCDSFAYQIHMLGFFHGDPHPGNVLVVYDRLRKRYVPALLDWEFVRTLDKKMHVAFSKMIYSVSTLNLTGLKESFEEMGFRFKQDREGFVDLEMYMNALRVAFREVEMGPAERDSVRESGYAAYKTTTELSGVRSRGPEESSAMEEWPGDVVLAVRVASLIHGICKELNESVSLLRIFSARAEQFLYKESLKLELNKPSETPEVRGFANKYERRLNDYIEVIMGENHVLGLQVAVVKGGRKLASISKGCRGEQNGNAVEEDTLFNGFFINLGILVMAVLLCVEKGYIALDDPICHYWDGFIRYGKRNITLRHILNHRSGVVAFFPRDFCLSTLLSYGEMVKVIEDSAPQIQIDHKTRYNPYFMGWVLSEVISLVTNQSAASFIEENIIRPFGLQDGIRIVHMSENQREIDGDNSQECSTGSSRRLFPLFSLSSSSASSLFTQDGFPGITGLSSIKSKLESGGDQLMNEIKEIIIQKLTPERMRTKAKEEPDKKDDEPTKKVRDRLAVVRRRKSTERFSSLPFECISKRLQQETSLYKPAGKTQARRLIKRPTEESSTKLSTLECLYLKPHVLDPLIYNSSALLDKWIPPASGKYTSLSLAKLYSHLCRGEIISQNLLREITRDQAITRDHSVEGLILTCGGPRKWSFGFQVLECDAFSDSRSKLRTSTSESIFRGIGHSDTGGNLSFCFPDLDLSIAILTNDHVKGSYTSQLILGHILKHFGLNFNNYVPISL